MQDAKNSTAQYQHNALVNMLVLKKGGRVLQHSEQTFIFSVLTSKSPFSEASKIDPRAIRHNGSYTNSPQTTQNEIHHSRKSVGGTYCNLILLY